MSSDPGTTTSDDLPVEEWYFGSANWPSEASGRSDGTAIFQVRWAPEEEWEDVPATEYLELRKAGLPPPRKDI